jgi:predicted secreted hydrolase
VQENVMSLVCQKYGCLLMVGLLTAFWAAATPPMAAAQAYSQVTGPCGLVFPDDHGAHSGFRTEWWYYTGNVSSVSGDRAYGFQLTFFRSRLRPPGAETRSAQRPSKWRTDQIYLAHAAVTDISGRRHLQSEKMARNAMGLAGTSRQGSQVAVRVLNWQAAIAPDGHHLSAVADEFSLDLDLTPLKPVVPHGRNGYSRKGQAPGRASCYYSFTRMTVSGAIGLSGRTVEVSGLGWMDHEYSSQPLEPGTIGWDWFSAQLDDQTELMIFLLRRQEGGLAQASSGTFVYPDGTAVALGREDLSVRVLEHWESPHSGARYPAKWRLSIQRLGLDLTLTPNLADQEMRTPRSTRVTYWEGSTTIQGRRTGRPVRGSGYVELTGYAGEFDAPL